MNKYKFDNFWTDRNGIFYNLVNVSYKKQIFSKYEFININGEEYLTGIGLPYIQDETVSKSKLFYDMMKLWHRCELQIEYSYSPYMFSDAEKKRIIDFCMRYGFPLLTNFDDYIGESPLYSTRKIYEELKAFGFAIAARSYLTKPVTDATWAKYINDTETASTLIIDYVSSVHFKFAPQFFTAFNGEFKYELVAESVSDIVRLQFCQLLNSGKLETCAICHGPFIKLHGNTLYCETCIEKYGRISDKNYKSSLRNDPIRNLCKKHMDKKRRELGAESKKYCLIRDEIIKLRKNAISEKWTIDELESKLKSIKCSYTDNDLTPNFDPHQRE